MLCMEASCHVIRPSLALGDMLCWGRGLLQTAGEKLLVAGSVDSRALVKLADNCDFGFHLMRP